MGRWSLAQWIFVTATEGLLILIVLAAVWRILHAIHTVGLSINGRVDQLVAEVRRSTIAETREAIRHEQEDR